MMETRDRVASCLLLCAVVAQLLVAGALRADERWTWAPASAEASARAWIPATGRADLVLEIAFPAARGCYTADLMLTDGDGQRLPSQGIALTADGAQFELSQSPSNRVGVFEAPPPIFQALKRARTLRVTTPDGESLFSLAGSAAAINSAWQACKDGGEAADAEDGSAEDVSAGDSAAPAAQPEGSFGDIIDGDPTAGASPQDRADAVPGAGAAVGAWVTRYAFPGLFLIFAIGNGFLIRSGIAKAFSLPRMSPPAAGRWRRGAALGGALGWCVLPLIAHAAFGLPGALLALAGYLAAGLIIAGMMEPAAVRYAAVRLSDWLWDLRFRASGGPRGSRLIVEGYRRAARRHASAPTAKTTDAEILTLFERVGSAFKSVAYQRGESLRAPRINFIVWKFLQAHERLSSDAFEAHLQQELSIYRKSGLPAPYRDELKL